MTTDPKITLDADAVWTAYDNARHVPLIDAPMDRKGAGKAWREQPRVYAMLNELGIEVRDSLREDVPPCVCGHTDGWHDEHDACTICFCDHFTPDEGRL